MTNETETWSEGCTDATKTILRQLAQGRLANEVSKPSHQIGDCPDTKCKCIIDDPEHEKGWKFGGRGELTITVSEGACKLTTKLSYTREFKKIAGHCLDPLPTSVRRSG